MTLPGQSDSEMEALVTVAGALDGLDRAAARRILKWADDRYVNPESGLKLDDMKALNAWTSAIVEVARQMKVTPMEVIQAAARTCVEEAKP